MDGRELAGIGYKEIFMPCFRALNPNETYFSELQAMKVYEVVVRGAFTFYGLLIFFSGMEADRNVKVVGGDVAVV